MNDGTSVDKVAAEAAGTLKGQPLIATIAEYDQPPEVWDRECGLCFYRYGHDDARKQSNNCGIVVDAGKKTPHQLFGVPKGEFLPEVIDGKQVGNYCPYFLPFTAE